MSISENDILLKWNAGSILHGTNDDSSDIDTRIVYKETAESILRQSPSGTIHDDITDTTWTPMISYNRELRKGGINAMEGLLADSANTIITPELNAIRDDIHRNPGNYLTRRTVHSIMGFTHSIIKSIDGMNDGTRKKWKAQSEAIRNLRLARVIMRGDIPVLSDGSDDIIGIKRGAFDDNGEWVPFLSRELEETRYMESMMGLNDSMPDSTYDWLMSILAGINKSTIEGM